MSGYIGSKASVTLVDGYTQTEADAEFVAKVGDTMTGGLTVGGSFTSLGIDDNATSTAVTIDASGRVTMPYQPAFDVGPTTTAAAGADVIFDVSNFNNGNHFNTSNGRFTAPVQGIYSFSFGTIKGPPDNVENDVLRFQLSKNGADGQYSREFRLAEGSLYGDNACMTWIVPMDAGDYVNIRVKANSAGGNYPAPQFTTFNGYLIG